MKAKDLKEGDRVWIVLPYEGGRGWAKITKLVHMGAIVTFEEGYRHISNWRAREVSLRAIVQKEGNDE